MSANGFKLTIELGNSAMSQKRHVAFALEEVARRLRKGVTEGGIKDINGNTVGSFEYQAGSKDEDYGDDL